MTGERNSRATEAFFGRRRGKALRPAQQAALDALLPKLKIDIGAPAPDSLAGIFDVATDEIRLEIGFGGGEHLLHRAATMPHAGFIGVEPFHNGMAKLMSALQAEPLTNIRVYDDDATQLLDWLPAASLCGIDLLYPDPWPKKRHWKRRFVSEANLDRFARVLKPGGEFRFASDIDTYVNWTLLACLAHPAFAWNARSADDWRKPFAGWPGTRYEAKAMREGRTPAYLTFVRSQ
jgi:tRNA (guanine-N7-)-methyltransferase